MLVWEENICGIEQQQKKVYGNGKATNNNKNTQKSGKQRKTRQGNDCMYQVEPNYELEPIFLLFFL